MVPASAPMPSPGILSRTGSCRDGKGPVQGAARLPSRSPHNTYLQALLSACDVNGKAIQWLPGRLGSNTGHGRGVGQGARAEFRARCGGALRAGPGGPPPSTLDVCDAAPHLPARPDAWYPRSAHAQQPETCIVILPGLVVELHVLSGSAGSSSDGLFCTSRGAPSPCERRSSASATQGCSFA